MQLTDLKAIIGETGLFALLGDAELERLVGAFTLVHFSLGQTVCRAGDEADAFYIVYSGRARVVGQTAQGEELTVGILTRGNHFGEQGLLTDSRRHYTIRAAGDLALNGTVNVASLNLEATTGDITQGANSTLTVTVGPTNLDAAGDITLDKANDFNGAVNVLGGQDVTLNDTNDLRVRELSAEAELLRADPALCAHVEPEGGVSDDLCSENEQGVIDEEGLVVFERGPESGAKELGP